MCVIFVAEDVKPTEEMIRKAYAANRDGAGIAWRQEGQVFWKKGLGLADILQLSEDLPLPQILHFRIASCGGTSKDITHPFPIDIRTSNVLEGSTEGEVLFHNGHWSDWEKHLLNGVERFGVPLPMGKWTDTRAMAFLIALYGKGYMDLIDEKGVAFGPDSMDFFWGRSGWDEENGVWCSNTHWKWGSVRQSTTDPTGAYSRGNVVDVTQMCKEQNCRETQNLNSLRYCPKHVWIGNQVARPAGQSAVVPPVVANGTATALGLIPSTQATPITAAASQGGRRRDIPFQLPAEPNHPLAVLARNYERGSVGWKGLKRGWKAWKREQAKLEKKLGKAVSPYAVLVPEPGLAKSAVAMDTQLP